MSYTWDDAAPKPDMRVSLPGRLLATIRFVLFLSWLVVVFPVIFVARLAERPFFGADRPITQRIAQAFFAGAVWIFGIPVRTEGTPMRTAGLVVSNHCSWLDIPIIYGRHPVFFVAKDDVAAWPFIGRLVRLSGALVITRDRRESAAQVGNQRDRVGVGQTLFLFTEGTSTDGLRMLPFRPTLFAAFTDPALRDIIRVQPVTVVYTAPRGADPRFYAWWGHMSLVPHLVKVLAQYPHGKVKVIYHAPVPAAGFADRKALAAHCEAVIRERFEAERAADA
jgi:1-acyl-sn-glycerol-3-phosphate acyltransferase